MCLDTFWCLHLIAFYDKNCCKYKQQSHSKTSFFCFFNILHPPESISTYPYYLRFPYLSNVFLRARSVGTIEPIITHI